MVFNKKSLLVVIGVLITALILTLFCAVSSSKDMVAIETALKAEWDKPGHPVRVPVVVVRGDYAIADWIQETRGGRALLRRDHKQWQTLLCGDVNMKKVNNLMLAGVPQADAEYLTASLDQAEANLVETDRALINSFKGIVDLLKEPQHHAH